MKSAPLACVVAALALLVVACAGSPSTPQPKAGAAPASASGPAQPGASAPEISDQKKMPIGHAFVVLSLPDPLPPGSRPPTSPLPKSATAASPLRAQPSGELPVLESIPAKLPAKIRSTNLPPLALPLPPPAKVAASTAAAVPAPAAAKPAPAAAPAAKPAAAAPATAPATGTVPTAKPPVPVTVPSTAPIVDPKSERQPDIARNLVVEVGSRIEIPFDGTGWTYLGERDGKDGILYESRRYEGAGLTFVLNPAKQGDFILRFQKQDLLRGTTNEELVAVKVVPKASPSTGAATLGAAANPGQGSVSATSMATSSPGAGASAVPPGAPVPSPATGGTAPSSSGTPVTSTPGAVPAGGAGSAAAGTSAALPTASTGQGSPAAGQVSPSAQAMASFLLSLPNSPDGLLQAAKNELSGGRVASCLAALDRFLALYPQGLDELYYLYGVALEQNGPTKDIKRAYSNYKKVHDDYPQSQFWDVATERMSYIERHYFDIR